jgi:hypothetical protein
MFAVRYSYRLKQSKQRQRTATAETADHQADTESLTDLTTYQLLERPKVVGWAEGFGVGWRCAAGRG